MSQRLNTEGCNDGLSFQSHLVRVCRPERELDRALRRIVPEVIEDGVFMFFWRNRVLRRELGRRLPSLPLAGIRRTSALGTEATDSTSRVELQLRLPALGLLDNPARRWHAKSLCLRERNPVEAVRTKRNVHHHSCTTNASDAASSLALLPPGSRTDSLPSCRPVHAGCP
jgi:hypothetical protein